MPKPIPFEIIEEEFKNAGLILLKLTEERKRKAIFICKKHIEQGEQTTSLSNFHRKNCACRMCGYEKTANAKRLKFDNVKLEFTKRKLTLLDDNYINSKTPLRYICNIHNHEEQQITLTRLKENEYVCKYCRKEHPITKTGNPRIRKTNFTYDYVFNVFKEYEFILLETEYVNNHIRMECYCIHHPDYIMHKCLAEVQQQGHRCRMCNADRQRMDEEFVRDLFLEKGFILDDTYKNSQTPLKCHCIYHLEKDLYISYDNMRDDKHGCKFCSNENNSGENHYNWKGGISPLEAYLRNNLIEWKNDSMKESEYKCIITDDKFDDIHHLYSFNLIVEEVIKENNIKLHKHINEYSDEELQEISEKVLAHHYDYPLGVCLREDVHKLFHKIYGYGDNTPEQFYEFKDNYLNGRL